MPGSEEFGDLLFSLIKARGWSQSQFAAKTGKKPGVIQFIRQGKRTPPLDHLGEWAEILGLEGDMLDRFLWMGAAAHVPKPAQAGIIRLVDRFIKLSSPDAVRTTEADVTLRVRETYAFPRRLILKPADP